MCNDYRLLTNVATLFDGFSETRIRIRFPEGAPNIEAREDIKITDMGPIVRGLDGEPGAGDLVQRRWSWPGQNGKPVYNFRSEGREFTSGRCLIPADGFYEWVRHEVACVIVRRALLDRTCHPIGSTLRGMAFRKRIV